MCINRSASLSAHRGPSMVPSEDQPRPQCILRREPEVVSRAGCHPLYHKSPSLLSKQLQKTYHQEIMTGPGKNTHQLDCLFSSVQFSHSVMSDSLQPHGLQHARVPCPSPTPELAQTHVHRVSDAIQKSHPLSSPSPLAPNPSQHQGFSQ